MDVDEVQSSGGQDEAVGASRWKPGDRCFAVWAGNNNYYTATIEKVSEDDETVTVTWDDKDNSHRTVKLSQVAELQDESVAWSSARIDSRAAVRQSPTKGRCLFVNEGCDPGKVVFVERPLLVALPASCPSLWQHLQKLHEAQPLQLGTVTFHYAALLSQLKLDLESVDIIMDKFVPEPDEEPGEDVLRILHSLQENMALVNELKLQELALEPRRLQRLVSAWRYNAFGHHKEDGLVLYNRISMCAHSCDPSCCWSYGDDDAFVLRARVNLKAGSELTISYLQDEDLLKSTTVRQTKLQNWRFTCQCERCCLKTDVGRGFKCRKCQLGISFPSKVYKHDGSWSVEMTPCTVCGSVMSPEDTKNMLNLEEEYVLRVENLDKNDIQDVDTVYQAACEIFENHWILYVMDTMLWEGLREKSLHDAMEHQRCRIRFHEHYYHRPTFILAWCHEELGDCISNQFATRKWQICQEFQKAYHMLSILCGSNHQYTVSPYNKLWQAVNNSQGQNSQTSNNNSQPAAHSSGEDLQQA
mmetsp:Transcript_34743/g.81108  ORF Transcript_34743/g.81108 Transcript_34743/m.81108 type:complete len:528 (+) Transcript_34743:80-1663(+)